MKLIFLSLIFSFSSLAADETVRAICDTGVQNGKMLKDWHKSGDKVCIEVSCQHADRKLDRTKCLRPTEHPNTIGVTFSDQVMKANSYGSHSRIHYATLYPGARCFEECRPASKKKMMGLMTKEEHGLERSSCLECLKSYTEPEEGGFVEYPEIPKKLYQGTLCHRLCAQPKGPFLEERVFSQECRQCVGLDGIKAKDFFYIITKSGACMEASSSDDKRMVPASVCKRPGLEVGQTFYHTSGGLMNFLFKSEPTCYEMDEESYGAFFKMKVDISYCQDKNIDNSDRGTIKDLPSGKGQVKSGSRATRQ